MKKYTFWIIGFFVAATLLTFYLVSRHQEKTRLLKNIQLENTLTQYWLDEYHKPYIDAKASKDALNTYYREKKTLDSLVETYRSTFGE